MGGRYINASGGIGKDEHRVIAERALGKPLPRGAEVHHVDGNPKNNSNSNLVICPSRAYHGLLHRRTRALDITGRADSGRCLYCGVWDSPENLYMHRRGAYHRACNCVAVKAYYQRVKRRPK